MRSGTRLGWRTFWVDYIFYFLLIGTIIYFWITPGWTWKNWEWGRWLASVAFIIASWKAHGIYRRRIIMVMLPSDPSPTLKERMDRYLLEHSFDRSAPTTLKEAVIETLEEYLRRREKDHAAKT